MYKTAFYLTLVALTGAITYFSFNQKFDPWQFCRFGDYRLYEVDKLGHFCVERSTKDIIKVAIKNNQLWEGHVLEAMYSLVKAGDTTIDAGAFIGTHTIFLAKLVGEKGRVHSFEPVEKTYQELMINTEVNQLTNVTLHKVALGKEEKIIEMNPVMKINAGGTQVGSGGDKALLKRLDSFEFKKVNLLKIDVEEFEDDLLDGAIQTLKKHRPFVIIEIQGGADHKMATLEVRNKIAATIKRLTDQNYKVLKIYGADFLGLPQERMATLSDKTKRFLNKIEKLHNKKGISTKKSQ